MFAGPHHEIPPQKGAAIETWIYEVSKRLLAYQVYIISLSNQFLPIREFRDGIYFHRIHMGKLYKRIFQKILGWDIYSYNDRIFNIIKEVNPAIVHIHNYPNSKELIPKIKKFNGKIKVVLHMHNLTKNIDKTFPQIDALVGCSHFISDYYKKIITAQKIKTIYNGVDVEKFKKILKYQDKTKKILNLNKNTKNIFYFGRISPEKGVDKFVKIASLFKDNSNFRFYCVGEVAQRGGRRKFYEDLLKFTKEEKINNIKFLDYISPQKIHLAYQMADLVVVPSKFDEPFGMVVIEAMAAKVPVVAANKGGMKEYLEDNKNCLVVYDYNNFEYIAKEKIIELINDKEKRKHLIDSAFKMVEDKFDWINISIATETIYNKLVY